MSPKYTPKEAAVWDSFNNFMTNLQENPNQSIGIRVEQLAEEKPNDIALYFQDQSWTWQALNEESNKIAHHFLNLGLKPGESIALMMENSPEYLFITTGINKIQGISALTNFNQKRQALTHSFNTAEPKWIIVDGNCLPSFNDVVKNLPLKNDQIFIVNNSKDIPHDFLSLPDELRGESKNNPKTTFNSILRETALYIYTSGTTGLPKAVIMQNYRLFTQSSVFSSLAQLTPDDIIYIPTPLYHNVGFGCSWPATLALGAKVVLRNRFSASEFWKDIQKYQATFFMYVGEIPRYLLNQPPSEYEKNHTLKKILGLGLRKEIWEQFKSRFEIEHIYEIYGSTEGHRPLFNADEVPGMIGRNNMGGFALAKVDPETGEFYKNEKGFCIKCKSGDIGMGLLKLKDSSFFTGYKNKEKTQEKMIHNVFRKNDTFFNTGDMLKLHDDLWISFVDRFGDTFRWKSENVSTLEVESILNSFPAIHMAAVYGVAIPNTEGKAGMAAIKLDPALKFDVGEFSRFVVDVFPGYSIPMFIRIRDDLETAGPYKIKKVDLRKEAYDVSIIQDPLNFWDSSSRKYVPLTDSLYHELMDGKLRI
jgi:acyl-CoA synthetase (AMP-forming)/AMP-acid ligase II